MPRGLILLSCTANWQKVQDEIARCQVDPEYIASTETLIEAWCPCIGNTDFALRVYSRTLEGMRLASGELRNKIVEKCECDYEQVSTSTILGSSYLERALIGTKAAEDKVDQLDPLAPLGNQEKKDAVSTNERIIIECALNSFVDNMYQQIHNITTVIHDSAPLGYTSVSESLDPLLGLIADMRESVRSAYGS